MFIIPAALLVAMTDWQQVYVVNFACIIAYCHIYICCKVYITTIWRSTPCSSIDTCTLVSSHLSYCLIHIRQLENIQRRASKFIFSDYTSDYKSRLQSIQQLPVMYWLELQDRMFFIKSLKEPPDNLNISNYVSFVSGNTHAASTSKLSIKYSCYRSSCHFFFTRITWLWNSIPSGTFSISHFFANNQISIIQCHLFSTSFSRNFDSNNVCSFHVLCPYSRCSRILY